jgi:3-hydroxyisobutyrate dehydrogenase-like beta-hydroxyacid dehydrogenase
MGSVAHMRVGWVGLGKMGRPMALHVANAGYALHVFDRDPKSVADFASVAPSLDLVSLAWECDVVVTSLPDDKAFETVLSTILRHLPKQGIVIDTSTVSPAACSGVRHLAGDKAYLAAPVSGSTAAAAAAKLTVFVSGPSAAFEDVKPLLSCFAAQIFHVGDQDQARFLKLAINHFIGSTGQVAAEAFALARKGRVRWSVLLDVLGQSAAASPLLIQKIEHLRRRDFSPSFTIAQMAKDMRLVVAAGAASKVEMPLARFVADSFGEQATDDLAHLDFFAAILAAEERSGLPAPELETLPS